VVGYWLGYMAVYSDQLKVMVHSKSRDIFVFFPGAAQPASGNAGITAISFFHIGVTAKKKYKNGYPRAQI